MYIYISRKQCCLKEARHKIIHVLWDCIYIKLKNRYNKTIVGIIRIVRKSEHLLLLGKQGVSGWERQREYHNDLLVDLGGVYINLFT